jgi:hypothetical protein
MALLVEGCDRNALADCVCVVADASRRFGSDIVAWNVATDDGISLDEARIKIDHATPAPELEERLFVVAQLFPSAAIPPMLEAIGLVRDSDRARSWLASAVPAMNVRVLLMAGSELELTTLPLPNTC